MKFKKSYNNSVALVEENGQELIVVGKGIGLRLVVDGNVSSH